MPRYNSAAPLPGREGQGTRSAAEGKPSGALSFGSFSLGKQRQGFALDRPQADPKGERAARVKVTRMRAAARIKNDLPRSGNKTLPPSQPPPASGGRGITAHYSFFPGSSAGRGRALGLLAGVLFLGGLGDCDCMAGATLSTDLRLGYTNTDDGSTQVDSLSVGGRLDAASAAWRGLSVGGTLYATTPLAGIDDDPLFLDSSGGPNGSGYVIPGQLWVQGEWGGTRIRLGRQEIDTPFADTDDIGMIPNTFEALVVENTDVEHLTLSAMHLRRWAGVDANKEKFSRLNGDRGVQVFGASYARGHWDAQAWYYRQSGATDILYLEGGADLLPGLHGGLQWTRQKDKAAHTHASAWGASLAYTLGDFTLSSDYNRVSGNGAVTNGYGGGPYFTSCDQNTIDGTPHIRAIAFGIGYDGIDGLGLGVRRVDFDQGVGDEWDTYASYRVSDAVSLDLVFSDMGPDGSNTKAFLNYHLELL